MTLSPIQTLRCAFVALLLGTLTACGFQPLYAVQDGQEGAVTLKNVRLANVLGSNSAKPFVYDAMSRKLSPQDGEAVYDLILTAQETAAPLAVQVDATVTRYTYNLFAEYQLVHRKTGQKFSGGVSAVASFNVVTSQYSTLFAERAAREKAAAQLATNLERDVLLQLKKERTASAKDDEE